MSRVKMTDPVNWGGGVIATLRQMIDAGKAIVRVVARFQGSARGSTRRAVFVDLVGTQCGVEVSGYVAEKQSDNDVAANEVIAHAAFPLR
jgi:hypothetical protein